MRWIFRSTIVGGGGLLLLSVWPATFEDVLFGIPFVCVSLPLLGLWCVVVLACAYADFVGRPIAPDRNERLAWKSAGIMFAVFVLIWLSVPMRIAFLLCRSELQKLADDPPIGALRDGRMDRRCGPYHVDRFRLDPRGGEHSSASKPEWTGWVRTRCLMALCTPRMVEAAHSATRVIDSSACSASGTRFRRQTIDVAAPFTLPSRRRTSRGEE